MGKTIEQRFAVRAFLINKSRERKDNILIMRRCGGSDSGLWDVPGGIVSVGENPYTSLRKWMKEETGLANIGIGPPFELGEKSFSVGGVEYQIIDNYFKCFTIFDVEELSGEYDSHEWINPTRFDAFDFVGGRRGALNNVFESYLENRARAKS